MLPREFLRDYIYDIPLDSFSPELMIATLNRIYIENQLTDQMDDRDY